LVLLALILAVVAFGLGTWLVRNEVASESDGGGGTCAGGCANGTSGTNGTASGTNGTNGTNGEDGANVTCFCPSYYYSANITGENTLVSGSVLISLDVPFPGDYYVVFDGRIFFGSGTVTFQIASPFGNFTADSYRQLIGPFSPEFQVYVPTSITIATVNQTVYVWWTGPTNAVLMFARSLRAIRVRLP
jgi:hypothetical protein